MVIKNLLCLIVKNRLQHSLKKVGVQRNLPESYDTIFREWLAAGIVEKVNEQN